MAIRLTMPRNITDPDIVSTGTNLTLTSVSRYTQHITVTSSGVVVTVPTGRGHRIVNRSPALSFDVDVVGPGNFTLTSGQAVIVSWDLDTSAHVYELQSTGPGSGGSANGTVIRISADGTQTTYTPASSTQQANFTALRTAVLAAVSGDVIEPDAKALYEYDGSPITLTSVDNVRIRNFKATRAIGDSYSRIITLTSCSDCEVSIDFDGRAGIAYEQSYPFNSASAISAVNENTPGGNTYVVEFSACTRCVLRDSYIREHAGDRILVSSLWPQFDTCYGIHILSTSQDCKVINSKFNYCGLSGISSNAPGTIIDGCEVRNAGWHGIRFGHTTGNQKVTIRNTQVIEDVPRLMGYRTTVNFNSTAILEKVLIDNCTFRHDYDWLDDMLGWSVATSYVIGDHVYSNSEIYERLTNGSGGSAPSGRIDTANWKWLMNYTSTYQMKLGNVDSAVINNCRFEHGKNGDAIGIRASIKLEDDTRHLSIVDSYLSGQIMATSTIVNDVDMTITRSQINASSEAAFASRVDKVGRLTVIDSVLNYEHRALNVSIDQFKTGFTSKGTDYVPFQVVETDSEIVLEADVTGIYETVDFDATNRIVDRTAETVTFTNATDRVNSSGTAFVDGRRVSFVMLAGGTMPSGLLDNTEYFVVNATANDFQVSATSGGSAINFTTDGAGTFTARGGRYIDGFGGHAKSDSADANLLMSGTADVKQWNSTLTGRQAHPTQTTGGSLSYATAFGSPLTVIRNKEWAGRGDVSQFTWTGTLWLPEEDSIVQTTLANVTTLTKLVEGQRVQITDRDPTTHFVYSNGAGTDDGGITLNVGAGKLVRQYTGAADVEWFGLKTTETATNNTTYLQAALDAHVPLQADPEKGYAINANVTWSSATGETLRIKGLTLLPTGAITAMTITSSDTNVATTLSSATRTGRYTVTVTSAVGLEVGDIVRIEATNASGWPWGGGCKKGEMSVIKDISGTTVTLANPLHHGYDTGAETINFIAHKPIGLELEDVTVDFVTVPSTTGTSGIAINDVVNGTIKNCKANACDTAGFVLNLSYNTHFRNFRGTNCGKAATALGYAILMQQTTACDVTDSEFYNNRKGVDYSGSFPNNSNAVRGCKFVGRQDTGMCIDTHSASNHLTIEGNEFMGGSNCVGSRGANLYVLNNTFMATGNAAIALDGPVNFVITGNVMRPGNYDYLFPHDTGNAYFVNLDDNGLTTAVIDIDDESQKIIANNTVKCKDAFVHISSDWTTISRMSINNNNFTALYNGGTKYFVRCLASCTFTDSRFDDNAIFNHAGTLVPLSNVLGCGLSNRTSKGTIATTGGGTVDLGSINSDYITITGTDTTASFGTAAQAGLVKHCEAAGVFQITDSSSLTCLGNANITTASGDTFGMRSDGSGNWTMTYYQRRATAP